MPSFASSRTTCSIIGRFATYAIGLGSFSVSGRSLVPKPPAITTAFIGRPPGEVCRLQEPEEPRKPHVSEGQGEEDQEDRAGADHPAVHAVGEPSAARRHRRPDEEVPRRVGEDVPGEEGGEAEWALPSGQDPVSQADG